MTYSIPASGTRRASTPSRLPIHAQRWPRVRRTLATARPGLVCPPVPPPVMTKKRGVTALAEGPDSLRARSARGLGGAFRTPHVSKSLERQLHETIDQRRVVDAG